MTDKEILQSNHGTCDRCHLPFESGDAQQFAGVYTFHNPQTCINRLRTQLAACKVDAERYRWLRNDGMPDLCACINGLPSYIRPEGPAGGFYSESEALDSAIDAALAARTAQEEPK